MIGATLYYIIFDNEEERNDEDRLCVLVLTEGCSAAVAKSMDVIAVATAHLEAPTFYNLAWQGITEGASTIANSFLSLLVLQPELSEQYFFSTCVLRPERLSNTAVACEANSATSFHAKFP